MLWKCCMQYASKYRKLSSGHRTGKDQFSLQSQRKAMPDCSNYQTIALILNTNRVMLKILQARLQQCIDSELPDVQTGFRKGRGTRDQTANIHWIIEKARVPEKHLLLLYWLCQSLCCVDHNKLWKILKEMGILDHLISLLRNLYAGQEATVRTGHGTTDWFQIQFSSVALSCPTLCDPMNCSTPGLPVHHQLLQSTQTHVHWVGDAIQPSHSLSSLSPPALNLSQHQGLFQWVTSLHEVAKLLEFQLQHQSFQWTPRTDLL